MLFLSIKDTQKESNSVDTCYHKSVSTVSIQCLLENVKKDQRSEKQWHNIWSRFSSPKKTLTHIWCASSRNNDWCCVIAFQFFWGTGDTLFNWHFNWHLHDFLSALDTKFFPIFEALVSHSRKTFVITRNNANTFFLCILNGPQPHLPILALSMVLTELNIWCGTVQIYLIW